MLSCKRANVMVKTEILSELFRDPEWSRKFEAAKTSREVTQVVSDFSRANGYVVKELSVGVIVMPKGEPK